MKLEEKIDIGSCLYFQQEEPVRIILIGIKPERYIAVTVPLKEGRKVNLRDRNKVLVYFPSGEKVYEFYSKVIKVIDDPIRYILLEYPEEIKIRERRRHKRIRCLVSAKVQYSGSKKEGVIKDISKKGCRIVFPLEKGDFLFKKDEPVIISCKFPGIPGEQEISGIIRNVTFSEDEMSVGIEFDEFAWWAPPY